MRTAGPSYSIAYTYDQVGNRLSKIDSGGTQVEYYYDYEDQVAYQSNNNRLMKAETYVLDGALLSTDYYYYNLSGNVTWVVTEQAGGSQQQMMMAGGGGEDPLASAEAADAALSEPEAPATGDLQDSLPPSQGGIEGGAMADRR